MPRDLESPDIWDESLERSRQRREAAARRDAAVRRRRTRRAARPVAGVAALSLAVAIVAGNVGGGSGEPVIVAAQAGNQGVAAGKKGALADAVPDVAPAARGVKAVVRERIERKRRAIARRRTKAVRIRAARQVRRNRALARRNRTRARRAIARGPRRGRSVRALQAAVSIGPDGVFGSATERALKRWQRRHGIRPDGIAGPQTRALLGLGQGRVLKRRTPARRRGGGRRGGGGGATPGVVGRVIAAANRIATKPYKYGGGHGSWNDTGYDCSGSISYALHGGGLLSSPLDSTGFMSYGAPGPGRHITIYAHSGHAYMVINGRKFDTSGRYEDGSRWGGSRSPAGYTVRHPPGY